MQPNLNSHVRSILAKCKQLNHLQQLQSHLLTLGYSQTQFYAFKLVRFCTLNLTNLTYARLIFDHLKSPNVYLYTAMITAYNAVSDYYSSFSLYREMVRGQRSRPNHFLFPMVLKACSEVVKPFGTEMVHAHIEKCGFGVNPVVETTLLDSYSRFCDDIGIARRLFDGMLERSVVTWTAMISGYTRVGMIDDAILLFEKVPDWQRDTPFWNSIIAGFAQNGLFVEAISVFRKMIWAEGLSKGNRPNQVTVVCALSACGHGGMLQLGKGIHSYVYRNDLNTVSHMANALVDMYGKCGSLREARRVFNTNTDKNLTSWNSMINCYALHGRSQSAISTFEEMQKQGDVVKPDGVTFIGLLNACTHGGLVDQGRRYYNMMIESQIEPNIAHNGCLIDLLGRAGQFDEALEVLGKMSTPDEVMWGSLLNACKIHKRTDLAELMVKKLIDIDPYNGGYVSMLANLYSEMGKWDDVQEVRKIIREKKAYKTPGCSWIDVDNQVHQFYSFDTSHPRGKEIYLVLGTLVDSS